MDLYEMMTIVNNVVDKVCYVNENSEFEYHPELKDFYLWLYYASFAVENREYETEDAIDENMAFDYFVNKNGVSEIYEHIPEVLRVSIEEAIDAKIKFMLDEHRAAMNVSLTDSALSNLVNLITEKIAENESLIETVGQENISKFITKYVERDKAMSPTQLVKAMKDNKVI